MSIDLLLLLLLFIDPGPLTSTQSFQFYTHGFDCLMNSCTTSRWLPLRLSISCCAVHDAVYEYECTIPGKEIAWIKAMRFFILLSTFYYYTFFSLRFFLFTLSVCCYVFNSFSLIRFLSIPCGSFPIYIHTESEQSRTQQKTHWDRRYLIQIAVCKFRCVRSLLFFIFFIINRSNFRVLHLVEKSFLRLTTTHIIYITKIFKTENFVCEEMQSENKNG